MIKVRRKLNQYNIGQLNECRHTLSRTIKIRIIIQMFILVLMLKFTSTSNPSHQKYIYSMEENSLFSLLQILWKITFL